MCDICEISAMSTGDLILDCGHDTGVYIYRDNHNQYFLNCNVLDLESKQINHCPNCGRFLDENKPLTVEGIGGMTGKPIFIFNEKYNKRGWYILKSITKDWLDLYKDDVVYQPYLKDYGKTWTAFRYEVTE